MEAFTIWVEGINLAHAKDKLIMKEPDASDIMDWTHESKEDLEKYLSMVREKQAKFGRSQQ